MGEIQAGDCRIRYGAGNSVVFLGIPEDGVDPKIWQVRCPECSRGMARRSARRHYALHDEEAAESGIMSAAAKGKRRKHDSPDPESEEESGEDSSDADETPITPRRPTQELLQEIRGDRPLDVVRSTVKAMRSSSYQIVAKHRKDFGTFGVTTPDLSESQLREVIQLGYLVQKISLSDNDPASQSSMAISENHARPSEDDIKCLEGGGIYALERLVGAMIKTDASCLLIRCIEGYCRDPRKDPHAEPLTANPSSVPTNAKTTQYPGRLKMRHLSDGHGNPRLIIGVRSRNYLITAGEHDGRIKIGPSRCGRFPILERSELLISKARQEEGLLTEDVLGLAQVRSHFGHKATYTTRRAGLLGCSALSQMPVTIFTLSLRGVPNASIFYTMWLRSRETGGWDHPQDGGSGAPGPCVSIREDPREHKVKVFPRGNAGPVARPRGRTVVGIPGGELFFNDINKKQEHAHPLNY